jgi:hypothetical protein
VQVEAIIVGIDNPMILGLVIVCAVGIFFAFMTFAVFCRYANTPIIKAAGNDSYLKSNARILR